MLERMPVLKAGSTISVGYDNFDVQALSVCDGGRIGFAGKAGEWHRRIDDNWHNANVYHKTLGVVSMGRVGNAIGQRAHAGFDMDVLYYARYQHPEAEKC